MKHRKILEAMLSYAKANRPEHVQEVSRRIREYDLDTGPKLNMPDEDLSKYGPKVRNG